LTLEVLKTERALNKVSNSDLPSFLLGNSLDRLKQKFNDERDRLASEDISKGIALHNLRNAGRRRSASSMRKDFSASVRISAAGSIRNAARSTSPDDDRSGISAGDLFKGTGAPNNLQSPWERSLPREEQYFNPRLLPQRQESLDEGAIIRQAILQSMCSAMGITNADLANQNLASSDQSLGQNPLDPRLNKSVNISPIFGLIDPFDPSEADSESNVSSTASPGHSPNIIDDFIDDVEIVYFQKGSVLVDQQERLPGLYYVIDGFLEVGITMDNEATERNLLGTLDGGNDDTEGSVRQSLFLVKPGSLAGYLPAVGGFRSFVDVKAKSDVVVGFLPRASLEHMVDRYPIILLTLARRLIATLNRSILHTDFALDFVQVHAGEVIYEQGQKSDDIYIILNGRLRAIQQKGNKIDLLGEFGNQDSVGELDVLTETLRPGSLHAIRETELARIPKTLFNTLAQEHPSITMKMSKVLAKRMRALMDTSVRQGSGDAVESVKTSSAIHNLRTVGILPVRDGIPIVEFANRLQSALAQIGVSVISLNQAAIFKHLGRHAFGKIAKLKLSQYLADLEEKYGLVLYIADTSVQSPWTSTCISQSDCILVVGVADDSPSIGEFERFLLTSKTTARKELVLLHPERFCPAGLTRKWLNNRVWINGGHHHIQMTLPSSAQRRVPNRRFAAIKQRVQVIQAEIQKYTGRKVRRQTPLYSNTAPFKSDFHRLARRLCGRAVALVLGGGGARGCAHVGVIRALEEAGVPIDIVGGTSIGAYVGALFAWDADVVPMYGRTKRFAGRMGSLWRFMLDLTYPS
jgi:lysophospholipid hydrolase